ncbi:MAG: alpha/beta fold hydrolase [Pseudomonadota bacterium]
MTQMSLLLIVALLASGAVRATELEMPGPEGPLRGTLLAPESPRAAALILPGSGPTDRDGNSPLGITAAPYRLLAEGLAGRGIATLRIDKRGIAGSAAALPDADSVRMADYVADARNWSARLMEETGAPCVWLLGHSEGGLITLSALGEDPGPYCGAVLIATPGHPLGEILRLQLRANPANAPLLEDAERIIAALEAGTEVPAEAIPVPLLPLFRPTVQGYLIDLLAIDPGEVAGGYEGPLAIVQGTHDLQVYVADAERLAGRAPDAALHLIDGVNHVLKAAPMDRAANIATYADADAPLAPEVLDAITGFIRAHTP